ESHEVPFLLIGPEDVNGRRSPSAANFLPMEALPKCFEEPKVISFEELVTLNSHAHSVYCKHPIRLASHGSWSAHVVLAIVGSMVSRGHLSPLMSFWRNSRSFAQIALRSAAMFAI